MCLLANNSYTQLFGGLFIFFVWGGNWLQINFIPRTIFPEDHWILIFVSALPHLQKPSDPRWPKGEEAGGGWELAVTRCVGGGEGAVKKFDNGFIVLVLSSLSFSCCSHSSWTEWEEPAHPTIRKRALGSPPITNAHYRHPHEKRAEYLRRWYRYSRYSWYSGRF